mmetsp:Transcript_13967/g.33457  ORF Transcript_13967/g.33457 Transcript_13967/m.33457 type:complete len:434 (-) Transcript_13967:666-1967(-)
MPSLVVGDQYSAREGHDSPATADVPAARAGVMHSTAAPPRTARDASGVSVPMRHLGSRAPAEASSVEAPTTATRNKAPPSSDELYSGDPNVCADIAAAAAPPRSTSSDTEDALTSSGAVATCNSTVPAPAVNAAAALAGDNDADGGGCARKVEMSHSTRAELTHAPSAAAARPPTTHVTPPLSDQPPPSSGIGKKSLPTTATGAAPPPPAAAATDGITVSTRGRGAYSTCPEAAPAASPPAHTSVTVANPAPTAPVGMHSASCPWESALEGTSALSPPPPPTTHISGSERSGYATRRNSAGVRSEASAAPTAGPPTKAYSPSNTAYENTAPAAAPKSPALPQEGVGQPRTGTTPTACAGLMHVAPRTDADAAPTTGPTLPNQHRHARPCPAAAAPAVTPDRATVVPPWAAPASGAAAGPLEALCSMNIVSSGV